MVSHPPLMTTHLTHTRQHHHHHNIPHIPTPPLALPPTHPPTHHLHQAYEEACASATESTPAVEEALRFYAEYGDEARLTALLERGIVNVMATDKVGGWVGGWA